MKFVTPIKSFINHDIKGYFQQSVIGGDILEVFFDVTLATPSPNSVHQKQRLKRNKKRRFVQGISNQYLSKSHGGVL